MGQQGPPRFHAEHTRVRSAGVSERSGEAPLPLGAGPVTAPAERPAGPCSPLEVPRGRVAGFPSSALSPVARCIQRGLINA